MRSVVKARVALAATLLLGMAIGAFGAAEFLRPRGGPERPPANGDVPRFVREMERYLEPHDDAQRAALRPLLMSTDSMNRVTVEQAQASMREALVQLRARANTVLDSAQLQRLDRFIADGDAGGRPHPPFGPPPGGPRGRP